MARVFTDLNIAKDKRNIFITNTDDTLKWYSKFPWEIFLELNSTKINFLTLNCYKNSSNLLINLSSRETLLTQLLLFTNFTSLYSYIDATYYFGKEKSVYFTTFSCFYNDVRLQFYSNIIIKKIPFINSISKLFIGSQWVERELKEFFKIFFINLSDTRRLLTDYTNIPDNTYNIFNNYSVVSQDLYF